MQEGLPVPSLGYKTLMYKCNALGCIYITWITAAVLHYTGIFRLTSIIDNFGHLMTVAMIVGFGVSFGMYFLTVATGNQIRMSGNFIYDVFMGACLNPRIGPIDLKMWLEVRIPWVLVFFMSVSGACKQYEELGYVTPVCDSFLSISDLLTESFVEHGLHVPCYLALPQRLVSSISPWQQRKSLMLAQYQGRGMYPSNLGHVPREVGLPRHLLELCWRSIRTYLQLYRHR